MQISTTRTIDAPIENVFNTVAHINEFSNALPHIVDVEFLTESTKGVGTRFCETREMRGKAHKTELEVTENVANERVRMVADNAGTAWDTVFTFQSNANKTELRMVMDARAKGFAARMMNKMIKGMVQNAVETDMDLVKAYCEGQFKKS